MLNISGNIQHKKLHKHVFLRPIENILRAKEPVTQLLLTSVSSIFFLEIFVYTELVLFVVGKLRGQRRYWDYSVVQTQTERQLAHSYSNKSLLIELYALVLSFGSPSFPVWAAAST